MVDDVLAGIQEAIAAGEYMSEAFQEQLSVFFNSVTDDIEALQSQIDQQNAADQLSAIPPQLDPGPFASAQVNAFKYDPKTKKLFVKFHGKDSADSGPTYSYDGVPKNIYDIFSKGSVAPRTTGRNRYHAWFKGVTPSLGASLNALIKDGGYSYNRLS